MFTWHDNGTLDITLGNVTLSGGYPAVDDVPLRPLRVYVKKGEAFFELEEGTLSLQVQEEEGGIALICTVSGLPGAHHISPLAGARVLGCTKVFYQGFGIAGPSGFGTVGEDICSDGLIALGGGEACLTLHAVDHRDYRIRFALSGEKLSAHVDVEGTLCSQCVLPAIRIRTGADFAGALSRCAKDIAAFMGARVPQKPAFHWCSWYYLYQNLDQATLEEYLAGFAAHRDIAPFTHIQVDAGYFPSCGDWLEGHPNFPKGLPGAAESICRAGYAPGVWVGPFMVGDNSKLFREHPDWMLKSADGGYVTPWQRYNEPKPWGYRDCDYYVLDTSHPEAMAYIFRVFRTLRQWGYTLFKTDFLLWGIQDSTKVLRHTPGKTSVQYYRELMATIRSAIGEDAAWLGCIAPFLPSLGFVDMMRIAGDVGAQWEPEGFGPTNMIRELSADMYFNNVYWQNDPDAVMLRDFHIHLTPGQVEALALYQAMTGGVITTSDPIHRIGQDRKDLLALIRPRSFVTPTFHNWQQDEAVKVISAPASGGKAVLLFNPTGEDRVLAHDWQSLLGEGSWHLLPLHGESRPAAQVPCTRVPAQGCVLYFASPEPLPTRPKNLWDWA